jgi:hypothetical protein
MLSPPPAMTRPPFIRMSRAGYYLPYRRLFSRGRVPGSSWSSAGPSFPPQVLHHRAGLDQPVMPGSDTWDDPSVQQPPDVSRGKPGYPCRLSHSDVLLIGQPCSFEESICGEYSGLPDELAAVPGSPCQGMGGIHRLLSAPGLRARSDPTGRLGSRGRMSCTSASLSTGSVPEPITAHLGL